MTEDILGVLKKADIIGYLKVLDVPSVWNSLTIEEQQMGDRSITGCFVRLMDDLETNILDSDCFLIHDQLKKREYLNVALMMPRDDPRLQEQTLKTAKMLFDYLRGQDEFSEKIKLKMQKVNFLNELDSRLKKVLDDYNENNNSSGVSD